MKGKGRRLARLLLVFACSASTLWTLGLVPARAEPQALSFDISPADLGTALLDFARLSGQQIAYDAGQITGKTSPGVRGHYGPKDALDRLLNGTGLKARRLDSGVFRIEPEIRLLNRDAARPPVMASQVLRALRSEDAPPTVVVVYGELPHDAISNKRRDLQLRDTVMSDDTRKLPASTVPEALQHIGGIQVTGSRGEVNGISIRGLNEINTLINGREIYSDTGRNLTLEYAPTNVFAGLDVYKSPAAQMVEGGVGGIINMRTRRPFDTTGPIDSLTLRGNSAGDGYTTFQATALFSRRFATPVGEMGLLISLADVPGRSRSDTVGIEPFSNRYDLIDFDRNGRLPGLPPPAPGADAGDLVIAPNGGGNSVDLVHRNRTAIDAVGQWRPSESLTLTLEYIDFGYRFARDSYVIYANRGPLLAAPGAPFTFSSEADASVVQSGAYRDVIFTSNTNYFNRRTDTRQLALTVNLTPDAYWHIDADMALTRSTRTDAWGGLRIGNAEAATGTRLAFDLTRPVPILDLSGADTTNPAIYSLMDSSHSISFSEGSGYAARVDATRRFTSGPVTAVEMGTRFTGRDTTSQAGTRQHLNADMPASVLRGAATPIPISNFFGGSGPGNLFERGVLAAPPDLVHDISRICQATGDAICYPAFEPARSYSSHETTTGIYGQLDYSFPAMGALVSGNAGVRIVGTHRTLSGFETSNAGVVTPFFSDRHETDVLPSLNARISLTPDLLLRLAADRQVTRPNFSDLSPALSFGYANSNRTLTGGGGNPQLKPLRSTSVDASLEYYFAPKSYAYVALFRKELEDFIQVVVSTEPVAFPEFPGYTTADITRLRNGKSGSLRGYQVGIQGSPGILWPPLRDMTMQFNYTRVDSHSPGPIAGTVVPLVGLSRNSFNLTMAYDKGPVHAGIAYTYRDDYVDTIAGPGSGSLPIFARPYGSVDASLNYKLNPHTEIGLDAANLGRSRFASYFGVADRPRFTTSGVARFGLVLRLTR